jgi:predicted DNA-binding transcriptional regulator AlpA
MEDEGRAIADHAEASPETPAACGSDEVAPFAARDELVSEAQAAVLLGVAPRTLQGWRRKGVSPGCVRLSYRSIRYRRRDLVAWINARFEPRHP